MAEHIFFMDICFALHIDVQEMSETIIYGSPQDVFAYVNHNDDVPKSITVSKREIGSFLFDLSSESQMSDYTQTANIAVPDDNVTFHYLRKVIDKADSIELSDDTRKWLSKHLEITQTKIITEDFVEHQRHVSFKSNRVYATQSMIDRALHGYAKDDLPMSFYKGDNNEDYAVTDMDLVSLVSYYLRTLYLNDLYPRFCMNCGRKFIAKTNVVDVLCRRNCKSERNAEKARRYKERHNNEYENLYLKIYKKWYARLKKSKTAMYNTDPSFIQCQEVFSIFTAESYDKRNAASNGDITPESFKEWIDKAEREMTGYWDLIMKKQ